MIIWETTKNFIKDIVNKNLVHHDNILERAEELNLNRKDRYNLVLVKNKNKKDFLEKETIERNFQITFRSKILTIIATYFAFE